MDIKQLQDFSSALSTKINWYEKRNPWEKNLQLLTQTKIDEFVLV